MPNPEEEMPNPEEEIHHPEEEIHHSEEEEEQRFKRPDVFKKTLENDSIIRGPVNIMFLTRVQ